MYLVFPEAVKAPLVAAALSLTLLQLPESDFHLVLHLVPERVQAEGEVAQLVSLHAQLESCSFKEFWASCAALETAGSPLPARLRTAARAFAAHSLAQVYRSMGAAAASDALSLPPTELAAWVLTQPGWALAGDVVTLPATAGASAADGQRTLFQR